MSNKVWTLYDGRYLNDPDEASMLILMESLEDIKDAYASGMYGDNIVIVEYETDGWHLVNPKIINYQSS